MAIGKQKARQEELFTVTAKLAQSPGPPFYRKLNQVLAEAQFDDFAETLCAPYYKAGGRPLISPGTYFRLLFIGYFEEIDSQRGIAWRGQDSLCLREFLGLALTQDGPDHSALTRIRQRLPGAVDGAAIVEVNVAPANQGDSQTGRKRWSERKSI